MEPFDWNIVIIGRWNVSIFTPSRVAANIFKLNSEEGINVDVPLDGLSPYRVRDPKEELIIIPEYNRLLINLISMDYETLGKGLEAGCTTLDWLPETPFSAAGFNIRFRTSEPDQEIIGLLDSPIDSKLGDIEGIDNVDITGRVITRSMVFKKGILNMAISGDKEGFSLLFNYHCDSKEKETLKEWLRTPVAEIQDSVKK